MRPVAGIDPASTGVFTRPGTAEAEHSKARARTAITGQRPRELVAIDVVVEPVLDLTTRSERRRLGIRLNDIRSDEADAIEHCRAVADVARATGQRAILAPSAADAAGTVLVVYLEGPPQGLEMRVTGDRRTL